MTEPSRRLKILLVDDDPDILEVLGEMLEALGHQIDTAANGQAALARLGQEAYDLVFSDVRMPGLDGPGLYRALVDRHPGLARRFVLVTGSGRTDEVREFAQATGVPIVLKPFDTAGLRRAIQVALAR